MWNMGCDTVYFMKTNLEIRWLQTYTLHMSGAGVPTLTKCGAKSKTLEDGSTHKSLLTK